MRTHLRTKGGQLAELPADCITEFLSLTKVVGLSLRRLLVSTMRLAEEPPRVAYRKTKAMRSPPSMLTSAVLHGQQTPVINTRVPDLPYSVSLRKWDHSF